MSPEEATLSRVVDILEGLGVPYMVTGSIAASYHGRPRATHDADVVIDPTPAQLDTLSARLTSAGFYVDADRAREALRERGQFNVIEMSQATKVDLIVRKERPFSIEEFRRRRTIDLGLGRPTAVVTVEDAILSKLEWAKRAGDSERHVRDAAGVLELNPAADRRYILHWAEQLGVADLWRRIAGLSGA